MHKACTQLIHVVHSLPEREFPKLSCGFCFCSYVNPLQSYSCFYTHRSIVRNRYYLIV